MTVVEGIEKTLDEVIKTDWKKPGAAKTTKAQRKVKGTISQKKRAASAKGKGRGRGGAGLRLWKGATAGNAKRLARNSAKGRGKGKGKATATGKGRSMRNGVLGVRRNALFQKKGRGKGGARGKGGGRGKGGVAVRKYSAPRALNPGGGQVFAAAVRATRKSQAGKGAAGKGKGYSGGYSLAIVAGGGKSSSKGAYGMERSKRGWGYKGAKGTTKGRLRVKGYGKKNTRSTMIKGGGKGARKGKGKGGKGGKGKRRLRNDVEEWRHDLYEVSQGGARKKSASDWGSKGGGRAPKRRKGGGKGGKSNSGKISAEDREMMKNITVVAQLDKVPKPAQGMFGTTGGGKSGGGRDRGSLSSRFSAW